MRIHLEPSSGVPLYLQVADGIRENIAAGVLAPGTEIPSSRALAVELRMNYHTVARAFQELEQDGTLRKKRGGNYVVEESPEVGVQLLRRDVDALCRRARALGVGADLLGRMVEQAMQERACG